MIHLVITKSSQLWLGKSWLHVWNRSSLATRWMAMSGENEGNTFQLAKLLPSKEKQTATPFQTQKGCFLYDLYTISGPKRSRLRRGAWYPWRLRCLQHSFFLHGWPHLWMWLDVRKKKEVGKPQAKSSRDLPHGLAEKLQSCFLDLFIYNYISELCLCPLVWCLRRPKEDTGFHGMEVIGGY